MNSENGTIYRDPDAVQQAARRGEPLEPIGPRVAEQDKRVDAKGQPYFDPYTGARRSRRDRRSKPAPNPARGLRAL